ncbi:MAG TPA: adenosylcobinamide-GDP ribazoletransferase, partial [Lachnospiraceae bacterium]|nr:adenosylcobinamide-GDP ribazoletransferase [Lachnospiraceae bacterium]
MYLLKSCAIAISMYSKIPVPRVEWNKKNMKYAMCFFPVVGAVLGILEFMMGKLLLKMGARTMIFAAAMTLIPILVTGGIHMDGFMDTIDALSSYGDREKKLEILKDSHAGAFAILGMCCYLLWNTSLWSQVTPRMLPVISMGYVLSRSLSGLSVAAFSP